MSKPWMWLSLLPLAFAALAGCLASELEPEVGELRAGVCKQDDSDPSYNVSFKEDVLPIFTREIGHAGCSCHMPDSRRPVGIELAGLNLSTYAKLRHGGNQSADEIVVPGDPCGSILLQKVSSAPPFGSRMPSDGPPYMTPIERQLLSDWIAEGAHDN